MSGLGLYQTWHGRAPDRTHLRTVDWGPRYRAVPVKAIEYDSDRQTGETTRYIHEFGPSARWWRPGLKGRTIRIPRNVVDLGTLRGLQDEGGWYRFRATLYGATLSGRHMLIFVQDDKAHVITGDFKLTERGIVG